jgi:hypothetical protein
MRTRKNVKINAEEFWGRRARRIVRVKHVSYIRLGGVESGE